MTAGVCLTLNGCSWFAKDPCVGPDADLSNPVCVTQTQGSYRDTDNERWYCLGDLEAKDWSCATSPQEASRQLNTADHWLAEISGHPGVSGSSVATLSKAPSSDKETETAQADNAMASQDAIASNDPPATNDRREIDTNSASPALLQPARLESTVFADGQSAIPAESEPAQASLTDTRAAEKQPRVEPDLSVEPVLSSLESEVILAPPSDYPTGTTLAEIYTADAKRRSNSSPALETLAPDAAISQARQLAEVANSDGASQQSISKPTSLIPQPASSTTHYLKSEPSVAVSSPIDFDNLKSPSSSGDPNFDYFMDLPPNDFAVQLKADRTLSGIQAFARKVSLDSPLVLKTIPSKSPLYILVLETFNDIQLASDAKNQWISQFDNGIEPWIRTVGSIQKTLHPIGPLD
jgi:hypothetical protein